MNTLAFAISISGLYLLSEWVIRIVMTPIVMRRRRPAAALAWLVVIFAVPWLGMVLYLLIGGTRLGAIRARRHDDVTQSSAARDRMAVIQALAERPRLAPKQQHVVTLASAMADLPIMSGNAAELISDGATLIERAIADIEQAEHHVHLAFYIWADDEIGRRMADALIAAAKRGVQCRVLIDHAGSYMLARDTVRRLRAHGVEAHYMLPVDLLRVAFRRIDIRNHRKIIIVDGRIGYTGSQNIIRDDYGHGGLAWFDMMVRIQGPTVLHLQQVFLEDWAYETGTTLSEEPLLPDPVRAGEIAMQVVPTGPRYPMQSLQNIVIEAINVAERHVIITTPYFVPDEPLLVALKLAALRGVKVELVTSARSDHRIVAAAGRAYFGELLEHDIHIHLFTDGLLHAKTMTVDDAFGMLGSANFDIRSFYLNYELNLLLFGDEITGKLRFMQNHYINRAETLSWETWRHRSSTRQFLDEAAALLSPML